MVSSLRGVLTTQHAGKFYGYASWDPGSGASDLLQSLPHICELHGSTSTVLISTLPHLGAAEHVLSLPILGRGACRCPAPG